MAELTLALILVLAQSLLPSACRFDILEATIIAGPTFSAEPTDNAESCGTSCCDTPHCIAFSFIADNPTSIPGHGCVRGGSCCFLRSAVTPTKWPQNWNPAVRSAYVNKTSTKVVVPAVQPFVFDNWPTCSTSSPGDTHRPGRSLPQELGTTARTVQTRSRLLPQCPQQQEASRTKRLTARHRETQSVPLEPQSPSNGRSLRSSRVHVNPEPFVEPTAAAARKRKRKRWVYLIQGSSVRHYPRLRPGPDRDVVWLIWKKTAVPPIPRPSSPHPTTRVLYRPGLTFTQGRNALLQEALAMSKDQPAPG